MVPAEVPGQGGGMTGTDFPGAGRPGPGSGYDTTESRTANSTASGWWARRPRRSENDRKIAGVAGGIARMLRVDPILIRIAFVVLAFFGGSGVLLYALGWLLLPSDSDEVSAGEALIGRGHSSTSPGVAICLSIVVAVGALSTFSPWGLPFFPALIIAITVGILLLRHKGRSWSPEQQRDFMSRVDRGVADLSDRASRIGNGWGQPDAAGRSPFDSPAFWERDGQGGWRQAGSGAAEGGPRPATAGPVNMSKPSPTGTPTAEQPAEPAPQTPPSWDPLGVAPFAWDLPEPTPLRTERDVQQGAGRQPRRAGVIGRVTIGLALIAGGLAAAGVFAGWWALSWAQVSAIALAVVALGLLVAAIRGRSAHLVGPGIFLALITLALTVTGLSGTGGYGEQRWTPASVGEVESRYTLNGGEGVLDLSGITVPAGQVLDVDVDVRAGHASVILPADTNYEATCSANVGRVECLDVAASGWDNDQTAVRTDVTDRGTIDIDVHVGAGYAEVSHG